MSRNSNVSRTKWMTLLKLAYKVHSKTSCKEIIFFYGSRKFTQYILHENTYWTLDIF